MNELKGWLKKILEAMRRRDATQEAFNLKFLETLGEVKRQSEHNGEMLKEVLGALGKLAKEKDELANDFTTHTKDRVKHLAARP